MQGLIVLDKPTGVTSHAAVARVRRCFGKGKNAPRAGHAGTLDPDASGVLVVLLGSARRLAEYLVGHDKAYRARVRLGARTSTDDAAGEVLESRPLPAELDRARVEAALARFLGEIDQTPPAVSAVHVDGQRAYQLARRGETPRLEPRRVRFDKIALAAFEPPEIELEIACGAGAYVRALARDLGEALSCGAHLARLVRTRSGSFSLEDSIGLEELEALAAAGRAAGALRPAREVLPDWPTFTPEAGAAARLANGNAVELEETVAEGPALALAPSGEVLAVVEVGRDGERLLARPRKVLAG